MRRFFAAAVLSASLILLAATASAQTVWTDGTGSWFTSGNWSAGVPTAAIEARINNGGTMQLFQSGAVASNVILGRDAGGSGTLNVFNVLQLSGSLTATTFMVVGNVGNGTMSISGTGSVTAQFGSIGNFGTSVGAVDVSGPDAIWTSTGSLTLVSGTLAISDGGTVHAGSGLIGATTGRANATTVTGAGSTWANDTTFQVGGFGGTDVVTVADGGLVTAGGQTILYPKSLFNIGTGGAPGTLQAGSVVADGTLHFNHTGPATFSSPLSGTGLVLKDGSGVGTITSAAGFSGSVIAQQGQLTLQNALGAADFSALFAGTLRFDAATVHLGASSIRANGGAAQYANTTVDGGFLRGPGTHTLLPGTTNAFEAVTTFTSTIVAQNGTATFSNFANGGMLINAADAMLTFDGATNTSSGTIVVNGSLLATDFSTDGILVVAAGGTLDNGANALVAGGGSRTTIDDGGVVFLSDDTAWELNGALLVNDGEINGTIDVNFGALAKGSGNFAGTVNVNDGGTFSPGDSPGTATLGGANFGAGGGYVFELRDASGSPGNGIDFIAIAGSLEITAGATANSRFTIAITSLDGSDQPGSAVSFDPDRAHSFKLLTAAGGITGFTPGAFILDHSAFRNDLAGGSFSITTAGNDLLLVFTPATLVTPTPTVAATPSVGAVSVRKCKSAIALRSAAFAQAKLGALQQCRSRVLAGTLAGVCPDDDPKTTQKIAAALAKLHRGIAKACGGKNRTCDSADSGIDADVSRTDTGFPAACTGHDPGCDNAIADRGCGDVATCLDCLGGAAVDHAIALASVAMPADPKAAKALNACQRAVGTRTTKLFTATSKALQKCWTAVANGKIPGPCPDPAKAAPAIAKAKHQLETAIAKACCGQNKTCNGADTGVDADFDPSTDIGLPSSCADVTIPGGPSCGGAITDVQSLTSCVGCATEFEVRCLTAAQFPAFVVPYPPECR